jgi:hypothetical protein
LRKLGPFALSNHGLNATALPRHPHKLYAGGLPVSARSSIQSCRARGPSFDLAGVLRFKLFSLHCHPFRRSAGPQFPSGQFTNLRMRTFIAVPSAIKVNNTEDPP